MLVNSVLVLALVGAVVSAAAATPTSSAVYVPPTTLPDYTEWNHEPFNVTAYLESAELEAQAKAHGKAHGTAKSPSKRGQPGVYMCQHPNWGWPCWWQPAVGQCVHTGGQLISLGPDSGVFCSKYDNDHCGGDAQWGNMEKPGFPSLHALSFKCQTSWIY